MTTLMKERKAREKQEKQKAEKNQKNQKNLIFPKGNSMREHACRTVIGQPSIKLCMDFGLYDECANCRLNPMRESSQETKA